MDQLSAAPTNSTRRLGYRWLSLLFLVATCAFLLLHFEGSLWSDSVDLAHHYALVTRLEDLGRLPATPDPSLGEMNVYPRWSHIFAAFLGSRLGSPLVGMQVTAVLALVALWAAIALIFSALPTRTLLVVSVIAAVLLVLDRLLLHFELFGSELISNYFYAQLVAQAVAMLVLGLVLYLERAGLSPVLGYAVLGVSVPLMQQIHPLPALELLAALGFLVILDFLALKQGKRVSLLISGVIISLASLALTVLDPEFRIMARLSDNNGLLNLTHTPNALALAIESVVVIALSALLVWYWTRSAAQDPQKSGLSLKYWGIFGAAAACLCLLQIVMLQFGYGSLYAAKKYAFGLNTALLLGLPLLVVFLKPLSAVGESGFVSRLAPIFKCAFPSLFVLAAVFAVLPRPASRLIAVSDAVSIERFAFQYRDPQPGYNSHQYDYGLGLYGDYHIFDYLITIGVLQAPRDRNADAISQGAALAKPSEVGRIFTRQGSTPWDVPACRLLTTPERFVILDGKCVLQSLAP